MLAPLGEGGLGRAYRVWDEAAEHECALKLVDAASLDALRSEFALLAGLYHPRLLRVHDFGSFSRDGAPIGFYTSDLLAGVSLSRYARGSRWPAVRRALGDALEGLAFLHGVGIQHGDIKPDNIIVGPDGRATLIDLSCARRLGVPVAELSGTPGFIPPELITGAEADARADFYAVGVTLQQIAPDESAALIAELCDPRPERRPADVVDILAALSDDREIDRGHGRSAHVLGRSREIGRFSVLLDALVSDTPALRGMALEGPQGIGKSRLLAEMKWRAQLRCQVTEAVSPGAAARHGVMRTLLTRAGAHAVGALADDADIDAVLRAAEELWLGAEPCALIIDDADQLRPDDRAALEAILRSLPDDGRLLVVVASERSLAPGASVERQRLAPLSPNDIARWAGALVSPRRLDELVRLSGGHPAHVERALRELSAGRWLEEDLAAAPSLESAEGFVALLRTLSPAERRTLALLVAGPQLDSTPEREEVLTGLARRGLVTRDAEGWHGLSQPADRDGLEAALPVELIQHAHRQVARGKGDSAIRLHSLLASGQLADAERLVRESPQWQAGSAPSGHLRSGSQRWSDALLWLSQRSVDAPVLIHIAQLQLALGRATRAVTAVARAIRRRPRGGLGRRALAIAGHACLQRQEPARAARYFERALAGAKRDRLATTALWVRALNQAGRYADAGRAAETALSELPPGDRSDVALELSAGLGIAESYLGRIDEARQHLGHAAEHFAEDAHPRDAARARSYLAILAFRSGDVETAALEHARALDIAERCRLSDMLPTLVLNLATARQQLGNWGAAMSLYERGRRIAVALGMTPARAILELNLAKLYAEIGVSERAEQMLQRAADSIVSGGIDHLDGQRHSIAGDIAGARGDHAAAEHAYRRAAALHQQRQESREHAEAAIDAAVAGLAQGADVRQLLAEARRALASLDAQDVAARLSLLEGQSQLQYGHDDEARRAIDRGIALADAAAQPLIVAEGQLALARWARAVGEHALQDASERSAHAAWQAVCDTLPSSLRETFWRHPRRAGLPAATVRAEPSQRSIDALRLRRVLELSARLSSTLAQDRVLELAMDAAIELTGAERGFLLLRDEGDGGRLRVAVAKNLDRERLGHGDLQFSTGIAERVVASDHPVVTFDARGDQRFADNRSVHAMRLQSVVCVPVAARGEMLGALYLDNRYARGRFGEDDVGVLLAFAGHIALSINNARLHAALEERNRRLAVEKSRVERLSRGQARQIAELEERVVQQRQVMERRYDYRAISHSSDAMRRVFDVLDRVIDSDLSVIIEGESGTGKELVSRAIHVNSPRRDAPLVAVNCGALSETLLESELFGHVRGAFTGADSERPGLMVAAQGGTLFLDELGEMSLTMQVKLLRALQEREVRPVGATATIPIDIRLVCATNRDLRAEVAAGRFREDLYYRVSVVALRLPPLRERREDILPIAEALLERLADRYGKPKPDIAPGAARALLRHDWPGNVRELENVLARAYVLSDRTTLYERDLASESFEQPAPTRRGRARNREEFERGEAERIHDALLDHRWNVSKAARTLGIPRNTLYRKLDRLGLARP